MEDEALDVVARGEVFLAGAGLDATVEAAVEVGGVDGEGV